jgi:acetylornithine deacetylase/succinyl-diaminopimelate desuccinylase-like protein
MGVSSDSLAADVAELVRIPSVNPLHDAMMPVIEALRREHERLIGVEPTSPLGTGTLSTATISGGNVIPDSCVLTLGRRIVPGEDPTTEFHRIATIARATCPLPIDVESANPPEPDGTIGSPAFYQAPDSELVRSLGEWTQTTPRVAPFGTNALRYVGFPRELAVFGPGSIDDAHQATESVAIADLVRLAAVYEQWLDPR